MLLNKEFRVQNQRSLADREKQFRFIAFSE